MGQAVLELYHRLVGGTLKDTGQKPTWPCAGTVCPQPTLPTASSTSVALHWARGELKAKEMGLTTTLKTLIPMNVGRGLRGQQARLPWHSLIRQIGGFWGR